MVLRGSRGVLNWPHYAVKNFQSAVKEVRSKIPTAELRRSIRPKVSGKNSEYFSIKYPALTRQFLACKCHHIKHLSGDISRMIQKYISINIALSLVSTRIQYVSVHYFWSWRVPNILGLDKFPIIPRLRFVFKFSGVYRFCCFDVYLRYIHSEKCCCRETGVSC